MFVIYYIEFSLLTDRKGALRGGRNPLKYKHSQTASHGIERPFSSPGGGWFWWVVAAGAVGGSYRSLWVLMEDLAVLLMEHSSVRRHFCEHGRIGSN